MWMPGHSGGGPKHGKRPTGARGEIVRRLDRAAGELNPILMVVTVGLLLVNVVAYIGREVPIHVSFWRVPTPATEARAVVALAEAVTQQPIR